MCLQEQVDELPPLRSYAQCVSEVANLHIVRYMDVMLTGMSAAERAQVWLEVQRIAMERKHAAFEVQRIAMERKAAFRGTLT